MGSWTIPRTPGRAARDEVAAYVRGFDNHDVVAANYAAGYGRWDAVYFAALHHAPSRKVYALVVLFAEEGRELWVKVLDETVCPTADGVGPAVLAALTPLDESANQYARQWRADAAQQLRAPLHGGAAR